MSGALAQEAATRAEEAGALRHERPRLGFLGVGWIGRNRMEAALRAGAADAAALADTSAEAVAAVRPGAPGAAVVDTLDDMLARGVDGVVIATPSGLHAEQAVRALERGVPVFCQKPVGRSAAETERVVRAARDADLLLGVDMSYRWTGALRAVRDAVRAGSVGRVHAVELVFHNAYAPGSAWCYDRALSGGGCVIDLGIHLVDAALWTLDFPALRSASGRLYHRGRPVAPGEVEDLALATLDLDGDVGARLACSWNMHLGQDAKIEVLFHGAEGSAAFVNVDGSFHDFRAELRRGAARETLAEPPDDWGGRALVDWAGRLARGDRYDAAAEDAVRVAEVLDRIVAP